MLPLGNSYPALLSILWITSPQVIQKLCTGLSTFNTVNASRPFKICECTATCEVVFLCLLVVTISYTLLQTLTSKHVIMYCFIRVLRVYPYCVLLNTSLLACMCVSVV
jgi:hypothetical protein